MNKLSSIKWEIASAAVAVALISYAAYILIGVYPDVLFTAQDRNIFAGDALFFHETIAKPFGFFQYIGGFLTQFFYYPALGASLLIAIWTAIFFLGVKVFRLKGLWRSLMIVPVACLLASTVDLGYWIYCLNISGYWFSQSLGLLTMLLLLWAARCTPRRLRIAWYAVVGFALFPVFGWFSYLFSLCLLFSQFEKSGESKSTPTFIDSIGVVLSIVSPLIFHALLFRDIPLDDVFHGGFPFFKTSTNASQTPSIPFYILTIATLITSLGAVLPSVKKVPAFATHIIVGALSAFAVWGSMFHDDNYLYEMQMTQATMNDDWGGVISVAEQTKTPSRTMVMLKNIALMNTGELGKRSFELGNDGIEINNTDSLNVNIMQIASPVIYYNYGKVNYSMRWCIEFGVSYGYSPYYMKMMARCADTTGEKELAERYTERMNRMLFYRDWKPAAASPIVKELQGAFPDVLDSDDNSCERYLITILSRARKDDSPIVSELSLFYSMILREPSRFASALYDYARLSKDDYLPREYEEAYCLFMDKNPDKFPYRVKITDDTKARYASFWDTGNRLAGYGYDEDGLREAMREDLGGTYWWFNAFGRTMY